MFLCRAGHHNPPDAVVQMRLDGLRGAIGGRVPQGACVTGWPSFLFFVGEPKSKQTTRPHIPRLWLRASHAAGRSAVAAWHPLKATHEAPAFLGVHANASMRAGPTLRLGLSFAGGVHLKFGGSAAVEDSLEKVEGLFPLVGLRGAFGGTTQHTPVVDEGFTGAQRPANPQPLCRSRA
ncbi:uncharacterized protein Tco025E_08569 [Trypanosoma conorhini]|uniref:Uncharacterized protein n=1 Tax=Trypanosoma conorhini TaxID=83891 RepID=A0A422N8F7_9TRYP|nr:uncharacterized protein Tco025E_08569 [Trypanosoma conorhini]RNF01726.1 hypothetical protein Tco025E_08569 [Trypanosoma conorhini]